MNALRCEEQAACRKLGGLPPDGGEVAGKGCAGDNLAAVRPLGVVAIDCWPDREDVVDDGVYAQGPCMLHPQSPLGVMPQLLSALAVP